MGCRVVAWGETIKLEESATLSAQARQLVACMGTGDLLFCKTVCL